MRRTISAVLWIPLLALLAEPSAGQRARFPTMIQAGSQAPSYGAPTTGAGAVAQPGWTSAASAQPYPTYPTPGAATAPGTSPAPAGVYPPASPAPGYGASQGTPPAAPPGYSPTPPTFNPPTYGPAPLATPGPGPTFGNPVLPSPSWDPYGAPGIQQPSLLPQDPYLQAPATTLPSMAPITGMTRFLQEIRLDYTWMDGQQNRANHFTFNNVEVTATFAFPFLYSQQNPLLVTPGFSWYFLDGPADPVMGADMPPQVYDAFMDFEWNPQVTPWFGGELGFRIGAYSDFEKWDGRAIRYTGQGLALLTLSPSIQFKAGLVYLDRVRVQMLPAGGFVWTPNPDWRFDILFPNPRLSRRLAMVGPTEWWLYVRGEYGGDSWVVFRRSLGFVDQVDYNDIRVALGTEFHRRGGMSGLFEVGVAVDRELYPRSGAPGPYPLPETFFLRAGLAF